MYDSGLSYYKEYLITSIPALQTDTVYRVTINISLADSSRFATDGFGVLFTTYGSPNQFAIGTLVETPQIDYSSYGIISDTINWTTLSSVFIADSAYTNLIIGGFKNANDMNIIDLNSSHKTTANAAYYYIDNIIVEKLSATGLISTNENNNIIVYPNPFIDHATFLFDNQQHYCHTLTIFNMQGQIIKKMDNITNDRVTIEFNELASGFYYYQLRNANGIVGNGKLNIR